MEAMRGWLCLILTVAMCAAAPKTETIAGTLMIRAGKTAVLETADHRSIELDGDAPTRKVLRDDRLNGMAVEATGHYTAANKFLVDPQHKRALVVKKDGAPKMITYWCEVCGIRAYAPGPCVCCQAETELELRNLDDIR
jgi:hypothetical protein